MPLDHLRAERAVQEPARALGLDPTETAAGIIRVVNAHMERAIRVISVERGYDPSEFTLVSFGGAGGLHACALAEALRIPRVLIPRHPGVLSALGCVAEDALRDGSRTVMLPENAMTSARLVRLFKPLRNRATRALSDEGFAPSAIRIGLWADLRYAGQSYELTVPCNDDPTSAVAAFHQAHQQRYGHASPDAPVEWVTLRVRATGEVNKPDLPRIPRGGPTPSKAAVADTGGPAPTLLRRHLRAGNRFRGPAIVAEDFATLWLPEGWSCRVDRYGHLLAETAS
jgi:N-methylhydantoinase A